MNDNLSPHRRYPKKVYDRLYKWDLEKHAVGIFDKPLRKSAIIFIRLIAWLPITANHLSLLSLVVAVIAILALYFNIPYGNIYAAILIQFTSMLGYADGDMARLKNISSKIGGLIDEICDVTKSVISYFAIAAGYYVQTGDQKTFMYLSLLLASRFILSYIGRSVSYFLTNMEVDSPIKIIAGGLQEKLGKFFHLPTYYFTYSDDIKYFIISIAFLFNQFLLLFYFFIILHCILILITCVNVWKFSRKRI